MFRETVSTIPISAGIGFTAGIQGAATRQIPLPAQMAVKTTLQIPDSARESGFSLHAPPSPARLVLQSPSVFMNQAPEMTATNGRAAHDSRDSLASFAAFPVLDYFISPEHLGDAGLSLAYTAPFLALFLFVTGAAKRSLRNAQDKALIASSEAREAPGTAHTLVTASQILGAAIFASQAMEGGFDLTQAFALLGVTSAISFVSALLGMTVDAARSHLTTGGKMTVGEPDPTLDRLRGALNVSLSEDKRFSVRAMRTLKMFLTGFGGWFREIKPENIQEQDLKQAFREHPEQTGLLIEKILLRATSRSASPAYRIRMLEALALVPELMGSKADFSNMLTALAPFTDTKNENLRAAVAALYNAVLLNSSAETRREAIEGLLIPHIWKIAGARDKIRFYKDPSRFFRYADFLTRVFPSLSAADIDTLLGKIYAVQPELKTNLEFLSRVQSRLPVNLKTSWTAERIAASGKNVSAFNATTINAATTPSEKLAALSSTIAKLPEYVGLEDVLPDFRKLLPTLPEKIRLAAAVRLAAAFSARPGEVAEFNHLLTDLVDAASGAGVQRRLNLAKGRLGKAPGGGKWQAESLASTGYLQAEYIDPQFLNSAQWLTELSDEERNDYLAHALFYATRQNDPILYAALVRRVESLEKSGYLREQRIANRPFVNKLHSLTRTDGLTSEEGKEAYLKIREILLPGITPGNYGIGTATATASDDQEADLKRRQAAAQAHAQPH